MSLKRLHSLVCTLLHKQKIKHIQGLQIQMQRAQAVFRFVGKFNYALAMAIGSFQSDTISISISIGCVYISRAID